MVEVEKEVEKREVEREEERKEVEREESDLCPECGSPRVIRDYKRGELVCQDCGCVIEDRYIDAGPEWRAFDSEQKEKRSRVGAPVTFSVDYDVPIIIRNNNEIKIIKIGEFVDSIINEGNVRRDGILEIASVRGYEALSFNSELTFSRISEVSRHPVNEMFEVTVEDGRSVKVTGSHSLFTVNERGITPVTVKFLKVGDLVILASSNLKVDWSRYAFDGCSETTSVNMHVFNQDLVALKVKSIVRVKPSGKYAYDLTVPECENFISDEGFLLHNTIHDKGLTTTIDWSNKDFYGKAISIRNRAQLFRLRKWQRRIRISNATERNLAFALSELDRMASALDLPKPVRETAAVIYRKAVDKNLIRGRSIEGVVAAALYAACRQVSIPRTLDEIANYSRVDRKEIGRTYRFIARELGLKLKPTSPIDYVRRFCRALGLSGEVQRKAIEIIKKAEEKELTSGRGPTGVAAAAIYIASILGGERRTQREVAEVAGVTEVTIRNRYKELAEKLGIEIIL